MSPSGCFNARLTIVAASLFISVVQGTYNASEPDRQTHIYGREFFVALPSDGWKLEANGSFLQIACVSGGSDPRAIGSITLLGKGYSEAFTAAPAASVELEGFKRLLQSKNTNVLNITSDTDIIVTLILQIGQTLSAYTAKPVRSLDKMYLVASYGLQEDNLSELTVVATSPTDTSVQFRSNANNVSFQWQGSDREMPCDLLRGQSCIYKTSGDFIGGQLQCTDPVMGVVGSRCSDEASGCSAHSMDNLYPLVSLGTRYTAVAVNIPDVSQTFRAVAVWNNTYISWSPNRGNMTLANGQTIDLNFDVGEAGTIIGSKPFLLLHHVERGTPATDIALVSVPPHEQLTRKTMTFSTYMYMYQVNHEPPPLKSFITITKLCNDDDIHLELISSSSPRTVSTELPTAVHLSDDEAVCGFSKELKPGVYTLKVNLERVDSSYSAILYTITETGVAAHILATELNQVVCGVDPKPSENVHFCPTKVVTIPPSIPPPTSSRPFVTTPGGQKENSGGGTIIAVVIVVLSLVAGSVVIVILMCRYCRGRWKRLEEADYMEDNPIRLDVLEQDGRQVFQFKQATNSSV